MTDRLRSDAESDEYIVVSYRATKPRKRDFLKVLLGRYTPTVRREARFTAEGLDRELRKTWTPEALAEQFYADPVLLALHGAKTEPTERPGEVAVPVFRRD